MFGTVIGDVTQIGLPFTKWYKYILYCIVLYADFQAKQDGGLTSARGKKEFRVVSLSCVTCKNKTSLHIFTGCTRSM